MAARFIPATGYLEEVAQLVDIAVKNLFRARPEPLGFLRGEEPGSHVWETAPTEVLVRELKADGVFRHRNADGIVDFGICLEVQFIPRPDELRRWLIKTLSLAEQLGVPVSLVVLYLHRGDRSSFPAELVVNPDTFPNRYAFVVYHLWELANAIRGGMLDVLGGLTPLLEDDEPEVLVAEGLELVRAAQVPEPVRDEALTTLFLVALRYLPAALVRTLFREEELMSLKELEPFSEWMAEAAHEGEVRGEARGEARARQADILEILRMRFESEAEPVRTMLQAITDLEALRMLLRAAVQAPDLAAFRAELAGFTSR